MGIRRRKKRKKKKKLLALTYFSSYWALSSSCMLYAAAKEGEGGWRPYMRYVHSCTRPNLLVLVAFSKTLANSC